MDGRYAADRRRWLLMPVTKDQAQMIANLAAASRPTGASRWDHAGIVAAVAKVKHLALPDVVTAVMRAAADRTIETPGAIGNMRSSAWTERVTKPTGWRPPKIDEECARHPGEWPDTCRGCAADQHAGEARTNEERRLRAVPPPSEYLEAKAAIVTPLHTADDRRPYVPEQPEPSKSEPEESDQ